MSTIDRDKIQHVAKLASLSLTDAEADRMTPQLISILKYVDELSELDTSNVEPTADVQLERANWRTDIIQPSLSNEDALNQAPRAVEGGFAVPTFVES